MMMKIALAGALLAAASVALAQADAPPPERPAPPPVTPGTGPYPAIMEEDPGLPLHVIYRPADLAALRGRKLGIVVWGNGACRANGSSARAHLTELASHGYLVIAPGKVYTPDAPPPRQQRGPDGRWPPVETTTRDVAAGIDWALAENRRAGSRYRGRIDPALVAVAGHSCGGIQALQLAADPRIKTVLIHNSGIFAPGASTLNGIDLAKADLARIRVPIIYTLGGPSDQAQGNGSDDFRRIDGVPAFLIEMPVGHGGTFARPSGGAVAQIAIDWLEWHLRGDPAAARSFTGANCRLCEVPGWHIERKRIP